MSKFFGTVQDLVTQGYSSQEALQSAAQQHNLPQDRLARMLPSVPCAPTGASAPPPPAAATPQPISAAPDVRADFQGVIYDALLSAAPAAGLCGMAGEKGGSGSAGERARAFRKIASAVLAGMTDQGTGGMAGDMDLDAAEDTEEQSTEAGEDSEALSGKGESESDEEPDAPPTPPS